MQKKSACYNSAKNVPTLK